LKRNEVSVFLQEKSRNFTCRKHRVDSFKESLVFDFSISENEGNCTTSWSCNIVELLNILFECGITVLFVKNNLEEGLSANKRGKLGKGLFSRTTHTDKKSVTSSSVNDT
jgi:hypothetical protein